MSIANEFEENDDGFLVSKADKYLTYTAVTDPTVTLKKHPLVKNCP